MATPEVGAHICFGDVTNHLPALEELERTQSADTWTINRHAQAGDVALFYIMRPLSAFVAWGVIQDEPRMQTAGPWRGYHVGPVTRVRMLPTPVPRLKLAARFPRWAYLRYPRRSVRVPDAYFERLMAYFEIPWRTASAGVS